LEEFVRTPRCTFDVSACMQEPGELVVSEFVPWTLPRYVIAIVTVSSMIGFSKSYVVAVEDQQSCESRSDTM
jgi:hypothetical protein